MPSRKDRRLPRSRGGVSIKKINTKSARAIQGPRSSKVVSWLDNAQIRTFFPFRGIGRQNGDDVIDAALDAAAIIAES